MIAALLAPAQAACLNEFNLVLTPAMVNRIGASVDFMGIVFRFSFVNFFMIAGTVGVAFLELDLLP